MIANRHTLRSFFSAFFFLIFFGSFSCYAEQPLAADKAFIFSATPAENNTLLLHWQIAPGYHLYKQRFSFKILEPKTATLGQINWPPAVTKHDNILGTYQIFRGDLSIPVPILHAANNNVILEVNYQGCSEAGYCYPPLQKKVTVNFANKSFMTTHDLPPSSTAKMKQLLDKGHFIIMFFAFMGLGLLLSFTPCVLPMIPILSGIILGHGHHISTGKAFRLSLTYVLSMSITYAVAGLLVGYLGGTLQAIFQKTWVIALFSLVYILMALSMFGLYDLQPPQKFEAVLANISAHQRAGHYLGVAIMGCLATLIISPCVTPALVAALGYLAQAGDMFVGAAALFAIGFGMGIPLLLIGPSTKLLPKTGHWMVTIKIIVGFLLLAMAILMLSRILSAFIISLLWASLAIGCAVYLGALSDGNKKGWAIFRRGLGLALFIYGIILMVTAITLHDRGAAHPSLKSSPGSALSFIKIDNQQDLTHAFALAKKQDKPIMLDFYADWCLACKEMDQTTLKDPQVIAKLANFTLLRADVTANNTAQKALMQQFNVIAPPTFLFFDSAGKEIASARIVGAISASAFLDHLAEVSTIPQVSR